MHYFALLMQFLRDRQKFLEDVSQGVGLENKIVSLLISSSILFALYGAIIGSFNSVLQMFASAIKLPILYLLTIIICLPTFYFFKLLLGSSRTFGQYLTVLLASMSLISLMLFGFAPITLFFRLSMNDYDFFKLFNVAVFALTGLIGFCFLYRGILFVDEQDPKANTANIDDILYQVWLGLYAFVGSQLGWTLRPFFGDPGQPFQLFRNLESNFYLHMMKKINESLGWF